jgi:hypothetical protein
MTRWRIQMEPLSGFLVGGVGEPPWGVHVASAFLSLPDSGQPAALLPGTSLKGVLRAAARRFSEARTGVACTTASDCHCTACRIFGTPDQPAKIAIRSALVPSGREERSRVSIERTTRTAARQSGGLWSEQRATSTDELQVHVEATEVLAPDEMAFLQAFWAWLKVVGLSVGRSKSTGSGALAIRSVEQLPDRTKRPYRAVGQDDEPGPYRLTLELLEPARVVGLRQREYYRDGLDTIPGGTLRGAIGWALVRQGESNAATDLFRSSRSIRVGTGYPLAPSDQTGGAPDRFVPWLSVALCRGKPRHRLNSALLRTAERLGANVPPAEACPRCGADLEMGEGTTVPTLVVGRTAIDARLGRVAHGMLFYEVAMAPGARFAAYLLARPDQAELIAGLGEVWVGGRKRSGQGRARLTVEPIEAPPLEARLASTKRILARWGAPDRDIAVVGFVGDAAFDEPPRRQFEARGLRIVAAELRGVPRGGWDEERNTPRPVREVVQGGSWLAVEAHGPEALAELSRLEAYGIDDPLGTEPVLVRVIDDWEVTEVAEGTAAAAHVDAADDQIREVRELCRRHREVLPERAQLQLLLRFAQSTSSLEELLLFVEYQGSRDQLRRSKPFLDELAELLGRRFAADIAGARRYLGWVVRAGAVERRAMDDEGRDRRGR